MYQIRFFTEEVRRYIHPFIAAAVESRGLIDDKGFQKDYERRIEELKTESQKSLREIERDAKEFISNAKRDAEKHLEEASRTLIGAKETASGISVRDAQEQFKRAQQALNKKVRLWAWMSGGCAAVFSAIGVYFYFAAPDASKDLDWSILYNTAIRITILTAIGTATAFCLKIFRAHLHMREKNHHRQRVANSIRGFADRPTPRNRRIGS